MENMLCSVWHRDIILKSTNVITQENHNSTRKTVSGMGRMTLWSVQLAPCESVPGKETNSNGLWRAGVSSCFLYLILCLSPVLSLLVVPSEISNHSVTQSFELIRKHELLNGSCLFSKVCNLIEMTISPLCLVLCIFWGIWEGHILHCLIHLQGANEMSVQVTWHFWGRSFKRP